MNCIFILGGSKVVITADEGLRGSKRIQLKNTVNKALETSDVVDTVLVYQRTGAEIQMQSGRDSFLEEVFIVFINEYFYLFYSFLSYIF